MTDGWSIWRSSANVVFDNPRVELNSEGVPTAIQLFAVGQNDSTHGDRCMYDPALREEILSNQRAENHDRRLPIDVEHKQVLGSDSIDGMQSYGWFTLSIEDDGVWARDVERTPMGLELVMSKAFRYWSPAFRVDDQGRVCAVLNLALTNFPATMGILPLVASRTKKMAEDTTNPPGEQTDDGESPTAEQELQAQLEAANARIAELEAQIADMQGSMDAQERDGIMSQRRFNEKQRGYWSKRPLADLREFAATLDEEQERSNSSETEDPPAFTRSRAPAAVPSADERADVRRLHGLPTRDELRARAKRDADRRLMINK